MKEKETAVILYNPDKNIYFATPFNGHYMLPAFDPGLEPAEQAAAHVLHYYHVTGKAVFKAIVFKHFQDKTDISVFYLCTVADDFTHPELEGRPLIKEKVQQDLGIFCIPVYEAVQNQSDKSVIAVHFYFNNLNQCIDFKKEIYHGTENPD